MSLTLTLIVIAKHNLVGLVYPQLQRITKAYRLLDGYAIGLMCLRQTNNYTYTCP